jgi:hypothetical protein
MNHRADEGNRRKKREGEKGFHIDYNLKSMNGPEGRTDVYDWDKTTDQLSFERLASITEGSHQNNKPAGSIKV